MSHTTRWIGGMLLLALSLVTSEVSAHPPGEGAGDERARGDSATSERVESDGDRPRASAGRSIDGRRRDRPAALAEGDAHGRAEDHHGTARHDEGHHDILGARLIFGSEWPGTGAIPVYGGGMLWEHGFWSGSIELEVAASLLFADRHRLVPLELLVKVPFRLGNTVELFVGAGGAADVIWGEGHTGIFPGVVTSAGLHLWMRERLGLLLEIDYLFIGDEPSIHELEGAVGLLIEL